MFMLNSAVTISAMENTADFSYGGGFWGGLTADNLPQTITVGGSAEDMSRQFYGGISQLMIGKK